MFEELASRGVLASSSGEGSVSGSLLLQRDSMTTATRKHLTGAALLLRVQSFVSMAGSVAACRQT